MARPSTFSVLDEHAFDGQLGELLQGWRAEGLSVTDIAFRLRTEHSVTISPDTVRRWLKLLDAEDVAT